MPAAAPVGLARSSIGAAFALFLVLGATAASFGAALPFLREQFALAPGQGAAVLVAFNLGALAATVCCGLGERLLEPRPVTVALVLVFVTGCVGAAAAPGWALFVGSVAVAGFGFGGVVLQLNITFATVFGTRNVLMINLLNATFGLGAGLGPLAVAAVGPINVRWVLLGSGLAALLCSNASRIVVARPVVEHATGSVRRRDVLLPVLPFALVGFLYAGLETSIGAWEPTHLTWTGTTPAAAAALTSLFWIGLAAGRVVIPLVAGRAGPAVLVCAGFGVATVALVASIDPDLAPAGYAVAGFVLAPILPTTLAWMAHHAPGSRLAGSAVLTACMLANALHPAVVGSVADPGAPGRIPSLLAVFAALGLGAALFATWRRSST